MKISVVTISYNQGRYLPACIESVLAQRGVEAEHILVDALSTDCTREVIARFKDRLGHVLIERDSGPAEGLNKGFSLATGDLFFYLNADDIVLPGSFEQVVEIFRTDPTLDVAYGDGVMIDEDGEVLRQVRSTRRFSPYSYLVGATVVLQQATYLRPGMFRKVGGFNEQNRTCWDGELLLDMAREGASFRHVQRNWGAFRVHPSSISSSGNHGAYERDRVRMFSKAYGRERNKADFAASMAMRAMSKLAKGSRQIF